MQCADQKMTGANLSFTEKQGGIVPAAIEQIHHGIGNRRHFGFVLAETVDHRGDIGHQLAAIQLEVIGCKSDVGTLALQDMSEPMGKLDVAVARPLGLAQRLEEGFIANPV